jgi:transposase InsO family protein
MAITRFTHRLHTLLALIGMLLTLLDDGMRFLCLRPNPALAAENLFLRKQLALYQERHVKPRRATHTTRLGFIWLAHWFDWRQALGLVQPATLIRWHRQGFRLFWRWKSRATFVRTYARAIVACDFCVVVTAMSHLLYVFVVMDHLTRYILHVNVTAYPTAPWTMQQLREAVPAEHPYRFLIHDRDTIFSQTLDRYVRYLGLRVLKTPPRSPQANALCKRLLRTLRRECLDFLIPLTENHLRCLLHEWVCHYNAGRPHLALGPGIPQPPPQSPVPLQTPPAPASAHEMAAVQVTPHLFQVSGCAERHDWADRTRA